MAAAVTLFHFLYPLFLVSGFIFVCQQVFVVLLFRNEPSAFSCYFVCDLFARCGVVPVVSGAGIMLDCISSATPVGVDDLYKLLFKKKSLLL